MKRQFVTERNGRSVVLYAGLLDMAHELGLRSIETEVLQWPTKANDMTATCRAVVTLVRDGETLRFTGHADATPVNVARGMDTCLPRLAETRAKARALRDAVNCGAAALEELPDYTADDEAAATKAATRPAPRPSSPRPASTDKTGAINPEQTDAILKLLRGRKIEGADVDLYCDSNYGKPLAELTYQEAADTIRALTQKVAA